MGDNKEIPCMDGTVLLLNASLLKVCLILKILFLNRRLKMLSLAWVEIVLWGMVFQW